MSHPVERYFALLKTESISHYSFSNTLQFQPGDEWEFNYSGALADTSRYFFRASSSLFLREVSGDWYFGGLTLTVDGVSVVSQSTPVPTGGKMHSIKVSITTAGDINILGAREGLTSSLPGIISNSVITIGGVVTTNPIGLSTGTSEPSLEANNTLTYVDIDNRELFKLSGDGTQWDNISPDPQELQAVIVLAESIEPPHAVGGIRSAIRTSIRSAIRSAIRVGTPSVVVPPFTPADRTLALWLDATDASTITFDGTDPTIIDQWDDKSGNNRHVSTTTTGRKPKLGTINGFDAIDFDGINDLLKADTYSPFGELTIYVLATNASTSNNDVNVLVSTSDTGGDSETGFTVINGSEFTSGDPRSYQVEGQLTSTALEYTNGILSAAIDNPRIELDVPAIFSATFDCVDSSPNVLNIGAFPDLGFFGHACIGGVIIVQGHDTDEQRIQMTDWFARTFEMATGYSESAWNDDEPFVDEEPFID